MIIIAFSLKANGWYDTEFMSVKKQRRKVVFAWAKREFRNLLKARKLGIRVPKAIIVLNNVLVMEFIGDLEPAKKLKDHIPKNLEKFFKKIEKYMLILHKNELVHSDLSSYNILNYKEEPIFIDLSQLMPLKIPIAKEYEERDVSNILKFFKKYGLSLDSDKIKKKFN